MRIALLLAVALSACSAVFSSEWATVRRDDLVLSVSITGVLKAVDSDEFGPPPIPSLWDFKIARMADEGKEVKEGEVVLMFDTTELERRLVEKQNERDSAAKEIEKKQSDNTLLLKEEALRLAEAEAALRKASLKVSQPTELVSNLERQLAELSLEEAQKEVEYLKNRLTFIKRRNAAELSILREKQKLAQQQVEEIQEQISRMSVKALRPGIVIHSVNWRGEKKKIGDSVWRAQKVLEVVALGDMKAEGEIDEVDASKVKIGQRVTLRLDAHPDVEITGKVESIQNTVQQQAPDNPLKVMRVELSLEQPEDLRLRPGMRFRGEVEIGRVEKSLIVPNEAVFVLPSGPAAYRKTKDGFEVVPLELGRRNQMYTEIQGGLKEGDEIALTDLSRQEGLEQ